MPDSLIKIFKEAVLALGAWVQQKKEQKILWSNYQPTAGLDVKTILPDWHNKEVARHNLRVICDQEGLTPDQKNLLSQVVHCESGYDVTATHANKKDGKVTSTDYGICQWNDYFHGKEITPEQALHDPEKAIRLMCKYVKAGQIKLWSCYALGMHKRYTS